MSKRKKNTFFRDWSGDIKLEWQAVLAITFLFAILFGCSGAAYLAQYLVDTAQCNQFAAMNPQFDFDFTYLNGCVVKTQEGNAWISAAKILELINQ